MTAWLTALAWLAGVALVAVTLPLVLELLTLTLAFILRRLGPAGPGEVPHLTVVVPAHDEEGLIAAGVQSLLHSAGGRARVLVIAHNCTDGTATAAANAGADVLVYDDPAARGKGRALQYGFAHAIAAGAEAVLVVDADSTVSPNLVPSVLAALAAGAAAVQCRYRMYSATADAKSQLAALAFQAFTYLRPAGRESLGLSAGLSGNGFALTADLLARVPYDAFSVAEDLEYHIHLVLAGERVRFLQEAVVSSHAPASSKGTTVQQSRWQGGRLWVARRWVPSLLAHILRGRFRMVEPMLDLCCAPLAFGVAALLAACLLPLPWVRGYAIVSLLIVMAHVLTAARAGGEFKKSLMLLATAPLYILWKVRLLPSLLRASRTDAAWVRTDRDPATPKPLLAESYLPK